MNGIKRSLLVSCLFVSVGSSIQQPLYAGRPGEKLKKIVTWFSKRPVLSMVIINMLKMGVWKASDQDLVIRNDIFFFIDSVCCLGLLLNAKVEHYDLRMLKKKNLALSTPLGEFNMPFSALNKNMQEKLLTRFKNQINGRIVFFKKISNLNYYVGLIFMIGSYMKYIRSSIKILSRPLKFRTFPNDDTKDTCLICKQEKKISELTSPCESIEHYYCQTCIEPWYKKNKKCPYCQRVLKHLTMKDINLFEKLRFIFNKAKNGIKSKKGMLFCLFMIIDFTRLQTMKALFNNIVRAECKMQKLRIFNSEMHNLS